MGENKGLAIRTPAQVGVNVAPQTEEDGVWDEKKAADLIVNLWRTRVLQKELEEQEILVSAEAEQPHKDPLSWFDRYITLLRVSFATEWRVLASVALLTSLQVLNVLVFVETLSMVVDDMGTYTYGNNAAGRVRVGNCWWLALSGLLASIFICVRAGLMDMSTARFHARLRDTLMAAVATRPTTWVEDNCHKGGQLAQSGDALKQNIYRSHLEVLWSTGQALGSLMGVVAVSPTLLLAAALTSFVQITVTCLHQRILYVRGMRVENGFAQVEYEATEFVNQLKTIRTYGAEEECRSILNDLTLFNLAGLLKHVRSAAAHEGLATGARVFQVVVMLAVAKSQLEDIRVSTGGVLAAIVLAEYATHHLVRIGMVFITTVPLGVRASAAVWEALHLDLLALPVELILERGGRQLARTPLGDLPVYADTVPTYAGGVPAKFHNERKGHISFHKVTYVYASRPGYKVLNCFTMDVPAGQVLGLMGKDGSGKSTLAALMMRWHTPTVGSVSIDGVDVHQYDKSYTREVAYIGQEPIIFSKSIRENIAFGVMNLSSGVSTVSEEQVLHAAQLADAHRFIRLLPQGYDTLLGENGYELPLHMQYSIVMARMFARDPAVVVVDDMDPAHVHTSAATSMRIALRRLMRFPVRRTGIIISHTPDDFGSCDLLARVGAGMLCEYGTVAEVKNDKASYYHNLVSAPKAGGSKAATSSTASKSMRRSERRSIRRSMVVQAGVNSALPAAIGEPMLEAAHEVGNLGPVFKHPVATLKNNQVFPQPRRDGG